MLPRERGAAACRHRTAGSRGDRLGGRCGAAPGGCLPVHAAAAAHGEVHGGASGKTVMRERATQHEPLARKREPAVARGNAYLALDRRQQCADVISRAQRVHGERAVVPDEELDLPGGAHRS